MKKMILTSVGVLALTAMFTTANAALIQVGTNLTLGDGSGITYTMAGDIATNPQNNGGTNDLRFTSDTGGSFTITFSGGTVALSMFNSEVSQGVNFDGITGTNALIVADTGAWSYTGGDLDLTNGNDGSGSDVVGGLGTSTVTIGNARIFVDNNGNNVANSGAPSSQSNWGTFSISGVSSITYTYSDATNYDGFRMDAVAVPEPATLGMVVAFGGGIMFIRRRFMM
jgi:hypothetical protein